jgi:hypothetical protein
MLEINNLIFYEDSIALRLHHDCPDAILMFVKTGVGITLRMMLDLLSKYVYFQLIRH